MDNSVCGPPPHENAARTGTVAETTDQARLTWTAPRPTRFRSGLQRGLKALPGRVTRHPGIPLLIFACDPTTITAVRDSTVVKRRSNNSPSLWGCVLPAAYALVASVSAQTPEPRHEPDAFLNQQRAVEERLRKEFDAQMGAAGKAAFDWGGWFNFNLFVFDDGVESSRTLRRNDLRLWGRLTLDHGAHEFYARTRLSFLDFNHGDSYDGDEDDVDGPNLERGFYRFDLAKASQAYNGPAGDYDLVVTAGRDLVQFGTGLALAAPLDHVSLRGVYHDFELTTLAGKTVGSSQDFDLSRSATRTRRNFLGGQLKYLGFERHEPFAYVLWQRDRNREAEYRPFQGFGYDSFYSGLGSTGELTQRLRYETEWVYESGDSFGDGRFVRRNDIDAWALRAELEYLFRGDHKPRASIEYLFGSGDSGRAGSPTNSVGGNTGDFTDKSFVGFGFRDTGLSFAPRYSNVHMWRVGGSFYPWPGQERLQRLELGTDWYLYQKHDASAAVSDPTASVGSGYLGWEMDYYLNWRVTSDLAWTARLGAFFPGEAFDDRTARTFLLLGVVWSF